MSGIFIETQGEDAVIAQIHPTDAARLVENPIAGATPLTYIHAGGKVQVLERNSAGTWLKVVFVDGNKKSHTGWIQTESVAEVTHRQAPFDLRELKVASVAHSESDDVAAQIAAERSKLWRSLLPFSWLWIGFWMMVGIGISGMLVAQGNVGWDFGVAAVVLGVLIGLVVGGMTYVIAQALADRPINERIRRLSDMER